MKLCYTPNCNDENPGYLVSREDNLVKGFLAIVSRDPDNPRYWQWAPYSLDERFKGRYPRRCDAADAALSEIDFSATSR